MHTKIAFGGGTVEMEVGIYMQTSVRMQSDRRAADAAHSVTTLYLSSTSRAVRGNEESGIRNEKHNGCEGVGNGKTDDSKPCQCTLQVLPVDTIADQVRLAQISGTNPPTRGTKHPNTLSARLNLIIVHLV